MSIGGHGRNLTAITGFAGDRFDNHGTIGQFRSFGFKKFLEEFRMRARQAQKDAALAFFHPVEISAHPLALAEALARNLLFIRQKPGCPSHVDENIAALDALDRAGDDFAFAFAEFGDHGSLFRLTDFLHDDLLGGLGGDTAVFPLALDREDDFFIQLRVFLDFARVGQEDMMLGIV